MLDRRGGLPVETAQPSKADTTTASGPRLRNSVVHAYGKPGGQNDMEASGTAKHEALFGTGEEETPKSVVLLNELTEVVEKLVTMDEGS